MTEIFIAFLLVLVALTVTSLVLLGATLVFVDWLDRFSTRAARRQRRLRDRH